MIDTSAPAFAFLYALVCISILFLPWLLIGSFVVRAARIAVVEASDGEHWMRVCFVRMIRATTKAVLLLYGSGMAIVLVAFGDDLGLGGAAAALIVSAIVGLTMGAFLGLFLGLIAFGAGLYRLDRVVPALRAAILLLASGFVLNILTQGLF